MRKQGFQHQPAALKQASAITPALSLLRSACSNFLRTKGRAPLSDTRSHFFKSLCSAASSSRFTVSNLSFVKYGPVVENTKAAPSPFAAYPPGRGTAARRSPRSTVPPAPRAEEHTGTAYRRRPSAPCFRSVAFSHGAQSGALSVEGKRQQLIAVWRSIHCLKTEFFCKGLV